MEFEKACRAGETLPVLTNTGKGRGRKRFATTAEGKGHLRVSGFHIWGLTLPHKG